MLELFNMLKWPQVLVIQVAVKTASIPNNIVVHLGAPDEDAPNVTVPFPEYIKNVASGEIYPNWPLNAIVANILVQISFALNRIYNEWYPSKGYDFDITSDPRYDQTYEEGREFFEKISQAVDELFNNYVVRVDHVQPLFASYCDGVKTTCDGLSQWGSVDLAKQGKTPLEILRYYYGDDVKIIYNAPIEDNVMTYPGIVLKVGSAGNSVKDLKVQLNRIGQNYPAIPAIIDSSEYFTVYTEDAVKAFQKNFDLPVTGEVDKATWYKIKYLYNAVQKVTNLYSEGIDFDNAELVYKETIGIGDSGEYIRSLNYLLSTVAYFDEKIPFFRPRSSTFNKQTEETVKAFQRTYGLEETGVVDRKTLTTLIEAYDNTLENIPKEYLINLNEFYPGVFLIKGMTGENIARLQGFIYLICDSLHNIPGVRINGEFDELTERSVIAIQRQVGLEDTGIVGPATWYQIVEKAKRVVKE